ncbi:MAG: HTTM domain-containing protein [Polyangiaceae bacterium]
MKRLVEATLARARRFFEGSLPALPIALFRIALGVLMILRSTDWARPWLHFHHYVWMSGVEYHPEVDPVTAPVLESPLLPGMSLGPIATRMLVDARLFCALLLVLGVRARVAAAVLALSSFALMFADRYRYFHHLYLLYFMCTWLAFVQSDARLSLERWLRRLPAPREVRRHGVQLLRLQLCAVYLWAGIAKLNTAWLSGDTFRELTRLTYVGGAVWQRAAELFGFPLLARVVCVSELALPFLLWGRRTRWFAIGAGASLHLGVHATMEVATFGAQMLLLLALFAVPDRVPERAMARPA